MIVYVIGENRDGPIKIGYATSSRARLASLQCGNPRKLYLFFEHETSEYRSVERSAHHFAGIKNELSGEWFNISAASAIDAIHKAADHVQAERLAGQREAAYWQGMEQRAADCGDATKPAIGKVFLIPGKTWGGHDRRAYVARERAAGNTPHVVASDD